MKKRFLLIIPLFFLFITGCDDGSIKLSCTDGEMTLVTTVKDNRIIKIKENGVEEKVTEQEWEQIKEFYEFKDKVSNNKIIKTLKKRNEENGFTCKIK